MVYPQSLRRTWQENLSKSQVVNSERAREIWAGWYKGLETRKENAWERNEVKLKGDCVLTWNYLGELTLQLSKCKAHPRNVNISILPLQTTSATGDLSFFLQPPWEHHCPFSLSLFPGLAPCTEQNGNVISAEFLSRAMVQLRTRSLLLPGKLVQP